MHLVLSLPEAEASPWMELFAQALPEATLARHEPGESRAQAKAADYVIAAYPSKTLFLEQPVPKAVFTVSAGVGHVLRDMPGHLVLVRVEDAGMAPQMVRYAVTAAMRFVQRLDLYRGAAARASMATADAARAGADHGWRDGIGRHRRRYRARACNPRFPGTRLREHDEDDPRRHLLCRS